MSPLKLSLCLHYHSSVEDDPWVDSGAPIADSTMQELIQDGLLTDLLDERCSTRPNQRFRPTPKLHAFVAMLEATPLPENRWLDPRTGETLEGYGF